MNDNSDEPIRWPLKFDGFECRTRQDWKADLVVIVFLIFVLSAFVSGFAVGWMSGKAFGQ